MRQAQQGAAPTVQLKASSSVADGRDYVEAYVQLTHFVESVDHLVTNGASHKHQDSNQAQR